MKKNKKLLFSILSIVLVVSIFVFWMCCKDRSWKDIEKDGQLKVITSYSPVNYYVNSDGEIDGFNYSILKHFVDSLGFSMEVTVENNLEKCMKDLKRGDYDIFMNLIPETSESSSVTLFSNSILFSHLVLVQYKARYLDDETNYISDLYMLEGKKVYVEKGGYNYLVLRNLRSELGVDFEIVELENVSSEMLCGMIIQDEIEYVAIDNYMVHSIISNFPLLDASVDLGIEQSFSWPINDDELKEKLDEFIKRNKNSEWWLELAKKYL